MKTFVHYISVNNIAFVVLISVLFLIVSCKSIGTDSFPALSETAWQLQSFGEASPPSDQDYSLMFDSENGFEGLNHCNYYWGDYEASVDGNIAIGPISTSYAGCGMDSWNEEFHRWLRTADTFEFEEDRLILSTKEGDLVFKRITAE